MADGDLVYRSVDLRPTDGSCKLDIVAGFWEPAEVRGEDNLIPGKAGLDTRTGDWVKHRRVIKLHGPVIGLGASVAARQQAFNAKMIALMALFSRTLTPGTMVVTVPYMGLPSGSKSIAARGVSVLMTPPVALAFCELDVELESIANPPDWA
jgi:hypothetical protein